MLDSVDFIQLRIAPLAYLLLQ